MNLLLVRHGQTVENAHNILQGQLPGTLSEKGIRQVQDLAKRLKQAPIDTLYTSDLRRCMQTMHIIRKSHPKSLLIKTKLLREIHHGILQGKSFQEIQWREKTKWKYIDVNWKPQGGETLMDLRHRAENFLQLIKAKHNHQTILVIGHEWINKALLAVIKCRPINQEILEKRGHRNASLRVVKF